MKAWVCLVAVLLNSVTCAVAAEDLASDVMILVSALKHKDPQFREKARERLQELGARATPAIPSLVQMLQEHDEDRANVAWRLLDGLKQHEPKRVEDAALSLVNDPRLPTDKRCSALWLVVHGIDFYSLDRATAATSLLKYTDVARLEELMTHVDNDGDRLFLARLLTVAKPDSQLIAPALVHVMAGENHIDRLYAVLNCATVQRTEPEIIEALARLLEDEFKDVRGMSVAVFKGLGPAAKAALPALERALKLEIALEGSLRVDLEEAVLIVKGSKPPVRESRGPVSSPMRGSDRTQLPPSQDPRP